MKIKTNDRKVGLFLSIPLVIAIRKEKAQLEKKGYDVKVTDLIYKRLRESYGLTNDDK
jgi:hypothetical protein